MHTYLHHGPAPVLGELGPQTKIEYVKPCSICGRELNRRVEHLELLLDGWEGQDLVTADGYYFVTSRLRKSLEDKGIRGVSFQEVTTSKSSGFLEMDPESEVKLPEFWQMMILGQCSGPSGWWEFAGICESCNRPLWNHTERVSAGLMAALQGEIGPPREVSADSWNGEDVFWLDDPGPPLATERFADVLKGLDVLEVALHPARWVVHEDYQRVGESVSQGSPCRP